MELPVLVLVVVLAVVTVQSPNLKVAVICMGLFSMVLSLLYLFLNAPDVALAEAAIGSTLSTVLLLVALNRYKVFRVCLVEGDATGSEEIRGIQDRVLKEIEIYCAAAELDMHLNRIHEEVTTVLGAFRYDLIIHFEQEKLRVYGRARNYRVAELEQHLSSKPDGSTLEWLHVLH